MNRRIRDKRSLEYRTIRFCSTLALALPAIFERRFSCALTPVPFLHRSRRQIITRAKPVNGAYRLKGRTAVDNLNRSLAIAVLMAASFLAGFIPLAPAVAQDSSPFVVGHWRLNDSFSDFKPGPPIRTENTDFVFVNPTSLTLTLEYAFFAPDGTFCGCDRDTLQPNGRTRYTMLGEQQANIFSTKLCPTQTDGVLKSIVFTSADQIGKGDAVQAGV